MNNANKRILLASPRGFCFGVERAVKMLDDIIKRSKEEEKEKKEIKPVYVRQEIVHNTALVNYYKSRGVVFVNEVDEVPDNGVVVFSAHGVSPSVRARAEEKNLRIVDTTCPLVTKIHKEAVRLKERGYSIILIGDAEHKEIIGIVGEAPDNIQVIKSEKDIDLIVCNDNSRIAWLSQTTLNVDDTQKIVDRLREKYPLIKAPPRSDICYATKERQLAVKNIADKCDLFIVAGSANSSNTARLAEVALEAGAANAVRVDSPEELDDIDFSSINTVGVTSGVSVADSQLIKIIAYLQKIGYVQSDV